MCLFMVIRCEKGMSFDGDVDGFAFGSLAEPLHELLQGAAAVIDVAGEQGATEEDAAAGVLGVVAGVDADAAAVGHVQQQGQPALEFGGPRDGHGVAAGGDGLGAQVVGGIEAGLQRVAEVGLAQFVDHVQASCRVRLRLFCSFE